MILLNDRALIKLQGQDILGFLQGLVTNDVLNLTEDQLLYALMLTPQGKFLYDFFIWQHNSSIYLDCNATDREEIMRKLNLYKLARDITIEANDDYQIAVVIGKQTSEQGHSFVDPRFPELMLRVYGNKFTASNKDLYQEFLCTNSIVDASRDMIKDRSFPLEYGMDHYNAISFTKGCYVGQELVARTKYRGTIRKKIYQITADQEIQASKGDLIIVNNQEIGIFCSSFQAIGKALLRSDYVNELIGDAKVLDGCISSAEQGSTMIKIHCL